MTEEEMKARIAELEADLSKAETEKKAALGEKFKASKTVETLQTQLTEAEENAKLASADELTKATSRITKLEKDLEAAIKRGDTAETGLRTFKADNEISKLLVANKVQSEDHDLVSTYLRSQMKFADDGAITIQDKGLEDFGKEFFSGAGKRYVSAPENSGGSATGGSSQIIKSHGYTKDNFSSRTTEWSMLAKSNPAEAKQIAIDCGRADLASDL